MCDIVLCRIRVFFGTIFLKTYLGWWRRFPGSTIRNAELTFSRSMHIDRADGSGLSRFRVVARRGQLWKKSCQIASMLATERKCLQNGDVQLRTGFYRERIQA